MVRTIFTLVAFLAFNIQATAQDFPQLRTVLQTGAVQQLNQYAASNSEIYEFDYPATGMYWRLYRELLPGYYEGIMQIYYGAPSNTEYVVHPFRIYTLVKDSTIISYDMRGLDANGRYNRSIVSGKSEAELKDFEQQFEARFKVPLQPQFLFIDTINYGQYCGEDSLITPQMKLVNQWVAQKDGDSLISWLRTGNTELQLYALAGLQQLQDEKPLSDEVIQMVEFVLSKKGNVNICTPSHERAAAIPLITESFKFVPRQQTD